MEGMAEKEEKDPRAPPENRALLGCRENLVPTSRLQALPVPKVRLGVLGWRDLVGLRAIKDKTELGDLGSNMFAGEGPHALMVLRWFIKVRLKLTSYILIKVLSYLEIFKLGKLAELQKSV